MSYLYMLDQSTKHKEQEERVEKAKDNQLKGRRVGKELPARLSAKQTSK